MDDVILTHLHEESDRKRERDEIHELEARLERAGVSVFEQLSEVH